MSSHHYRTTPSNVTPVTAAGRLVHGPACVAADLLEDSGKQTTGEALALPPEKQPVPTKADRDWANQDQRKGNNRVRSAGPVVNQPLLIDRIDAKQAGSGNGRRGDLSPGSPLRRPCGVICCKLARAGRVRSDLLFYDAISAGPVTCKPACNMRKTGGPNDCRSAVESNRWDPCGDPALAKEAMDAGAVGEDSSNLINSAATPIVSGEASSKERRCQPIPSTARAVGQGSGFWGAGGLATIHREGAGEAPLLKGCVNNPDGLKPELMVSGADCQGRSRS
jgi:hypothetical protein